MWFGAHPASPSIAELDGVSVALDELIAQSPTLVMGDDVVSRFGAGLPYLLKLIAAARPLSLQVHPHIGRAVVGFAEENAAGIPLDALRRNFKDRNHKPELVYALTEFEALCGFRAPRRGALCGS